MNALHSILASPSLEEVFQQTSEHMNSSADPRYLYAVLAGAAALVLLLVALNGRKKRQSTPRAINHQGKLLKEMVRRLPLRGGEVRQLKILASEQELSSPLLLVLCPSLLARAVGAKTRADRKTVMRVARKMGVVRSAKP